MFAAPMTNGFDSLFNNSNTSMNSLGNNIQNSMESLNQQVQSGQMVNPATLLNLQINVQNYTLLINTITSLVKSSADAEKTVAQNIGM